MIEITTDNFNEEVLECKGRVLIDFWAEWCGPCRMMGSVFEELSEMYTDIKFGKVNVDEQEEIAREYNIMSIPTLIFFEDGKVAGQFTGAYSTQNIIEYFKL